MRDEFSNKVKEVLAERVGYLCSNPECRHITVGPHSKAEKSVNIGVAAHITAAAPGGKRYNSLMSKEERKSINNGIWLCQSCAKRIDSDEEKYTVELLHAWKKDAERETQKRMKFGEKGDFCGTLIHRKDINEDMGQQFMSAKIERLIKKFLMFKDKFQLLKLQILEENYREALILINELVTLPDNEIKEIEIWLNFISGNYLEVIEKVESEGESSRFITLVYAQCLMISGKYEKAIKICNCANELEESYIAYWLLAMCYEQEGNYEKRESALNNMLKFSENKEITYYEMGRLVFPSKKSIEFLTNAININVKFAEAYFLRGRVERFWGEWKKAIEDIKKYQEISGDYLNAAVLLELALACYNDKSEECNIYISRWIENMWNSDEGIAIEDGKGVLCLDIGYEYENIVEIERKGDSLEVVINKEPIVMLELKTRAQSGIGLYISPIDQMYLQWVGSCSQDAKLERSLPALFRFVESDEFYEKIKGNLLSQNVLKVENKMEMFEEYTVLNEDISVNIIKQQKSLNAKIKIGRYIMDEWIPKVGEGFHAFRSRVQNGACSGKAAVIIQSPNYLCQITFNSSRIEITDKY